MDPNQGTGSKPRHKSKKSTESFAGKGDVFASLNSFEESEHDRGADSQVANNDSEASTSDLFFASAKRFNSSSFNSLSSSDIPSEDDSIHVDHKKVTFSSSTVGPPDDVHPLSKYTKLNLLPKRDKRPDAQMNSKVKPVMESPTVQMMERPPPGFDPNRIPESIFASKPPGPTDWSVASNESLFSIRIGNSSFSKDQVVSVPKEIVPQMGEVEISQEEPEIGELGKSSREQTTDSGNPPAELAESESLEDYYEVESKISQQEEATEDITIVGIIPGQAQNDQRKAKPATPKASSKVLTNAKGTHMMQVNTLKNKKASECCCSGCTCEFCCSVKLRCCFCKWPSCDCCERPDCNNCCRWPSCCSNFCSFKCCTCQGCDTFCSLKSCKWPSCTNCCSFKSLKCCKWLSCDSFCCCKSCKFSICEKCCKWPSCSKGSCCGGCGDCSNCCKWPSCKICCKWPSCNCLSSWSCTNCCKRPSCNIFSCCSCTSCKRPSCSWPSCSGCSFKWRYIFCCLPKPTRRTSRRSRRTCGWISSIFCC